MITKFKIFEANKYTDYDPEDKFNVGDRVIVHGKYSTITFNGESGTIINFYEAGDGNKKREILVKFDNKFDSNLMAGDRKEDPTKSTLF